MLRFQALLVILLIARYVEGSCYGRCFEKYDRANSCHCDPQWSCEGRCWEDYDPENPCHCNKRCREFNNCCSDFNRICRKEGARENVEKPVVSNVVKPVVPGTDGGTCERGSCDSGEGGNVVEPVVSGTGGASCAASTRSSATSKELSCLAQLLWEGDVNRASSSQYKLNLQGQISALSRHQDLASDKLFSYVDEAALFKKPTYKTYLALLDNYVPFTQTDEVVTSAEHAEIDAFMAAIQGTDVITNLHQFLAYKGEIDIFIYIYINYVSICLASSNLATFMADLREMWFGLYSRSSGDAMDSSGFEHVFLGEFKKGKVSGFHNWLTLYLLEKSREADYYGYIWDKQPNILAVQLRWESLYKELGSMFYGASPEFDLAMYTMCYVTSPDRLCRFDMAGASVGIRTWSWGKSNYGGKRYLASAYPV
ncbi:PREDICTED: poly(U)-specific endoribonuclease-D-like [Branchiostoma belcheri]|uniref:Uridylate-specific endoribonuclease n=1 Tax=Branchiostoma belcheri TaxID=7741 RepID=A0A6P4YFR7_BRABE|nr:PREDICTED: poly(U)-specific endoribonuclease-D-like [Branchiostoma belcheri]